MRNTDGLQATITLGPVHRVGQDLSASLEMVITLPMPDQDDHLPDTIEANVHAAGLEVQRQLFRALIEKADRELVLEGRDGKGGEGIQRRGTRPFTFKTLFGAVTVQRCRVSHRHDGTTEIPSASVWGTPHQLAITGNLRDAVCDQMSEHSPARALRRSARAGDADLLGRSTVIEIVHEQGGRLIAAQRQRATPPSTPHPRRNARRWARAWPTIPTGCRRTSPTTTRRSTRKTPSGNRHRRRSGS